MLAFLQGSPAQGILQPHEYSPIALKTFGVRFSQMHGAAQAPAINIPFLATGGWWL
jgi:hypothetical protein